MVYQLKRRTGTCPKKKNLIVVIWSTMPVKHPMPNAPQNEGRGLALVGAARLVKWSRAPILGILLPLFKLDREDTH